MRIQGAHADPRPRAGEPRHEAIGQPGFGQHASSRDLVEHFPQRGVQRHVDHGQAVRAGHRLVGPQVEHHGEVVHAAQFGQQLGVARIMVSGAMQGLLVQRGRGDGGHPAFESQRAAATRARRPPGRRGRRSCPASTCSASSEPQARQGITSGDGSAWSGRSISTTVTPSATGPPRGAGSPDVRPPTAGTIRGPRFRVQAPTMISGPTPAGSPMVTAINGFCFIAHERLARRKNYCIVLTRRTRAGGEGFSSGFRILDLSCVGAMPDRNTDTK